MKNLFTFMAIFAFTTFAFGQTETVRLDASVFFASASHEPDAAELAKLNAFASQLTSYADYTLKIEAFTDEQGTDAYNAALARRRADAVARALALRAVVASTTEVLTYGEQQARKNTNDDAERRTDRRVDLVATVVRWTDARAAIAAARASQRQTLTIDDPTARQTFSGSQGGVFMLEPNSLVRADGTPAAGPVAIELVEAYDLSDMIVAGLTTTAAGKRLATGGMVNITATDAAGQTLQLREGISLTASIPTDDFNERMRIFSGAEHNDAGTPTDWSLTDRGVAPSAEAMFVVNTRQLEITDFKVSAEKNVGSRLAAWRRNNPEPKKPEVLLPRSTRKVPREVDTEQIVYSPTGLKKLFMSKSRQEAETVKAREKAQRTYNRRLARYEDNRAYNAEIPALNAEAARKYDEEITAWNTAFEQAKMGMMDEATRTLYAAAKKRQEAYRAAREARIAALGNALANAADLSDRKNDVSRYFFAVSQLGWTNVDIYTQDEAPMQVMASVPGSTPDASVVLVPTDRRSVIAFTPGADGNWVRNGIPRGVGYHVIAYEVLNGQLMLAHSFVAAADESVTELAYQPVAVTELKEKLAGILN